MNTQGMTVKIDGDNPLTQPNLNPYDYPIRDVPKRTVFTDQERSELIDIFLSAQDVNTQLEAITRTLDGELIHQIILDNRGVERKRIIIEYPPRP